MQCNEYNLLENRQMRYLMQFQTKTYSNVVNHNQRTHNHIITLLVLALLSLSTFGCNTYYMSEGNYIAPDLPKSELATIQIDTDGQWIQRTNQVALRINGKIALRNNFENNKGAINKVLVAPGKHQLSITVLTDTYPDGVRQDLQIISKFSAEVKADMAYLLNVKFDNNVDDDDLTVELIDTNTDKVVSKSNLSTKSIVDQQNPGNISVEYEF